MLKYLLQRNIVVIPKSYTPSRIVENIELFDFVLNEIDLKILNKLDVGERARIGFSSPSLDRYFLSFFYYANSVWNDFFLVIATESMRNGHLGPYNLITPNPIDFSKKILQ